jgi:serine O-acetyltransferase
MTTTTSTSGVCELLRQDLQRQKLQNVTFLTILSHLRRAGFSATFLYRLAAASTRKGAFGKFTANFLTRLNLMINSCDIHPEAVIGPGFMIAHPTGAVIGRSVIGRDVTVQQNVTLGMRQFIGDETDPANYPTIGDNVCISAGAVILGPIKIGDGAVIGANAVVLQDVPEHCTAVGVPARIIVRNAAKDAQGG